MNAMFEYNFFAFDKLCGKKNQTGSRRMIETFKFLFLLVNFSLLTSLVLNFKIQSFNFFVFLENVVLKFSDFRL